MPLYDYRCKSCSWEGEKMAPIAVRHSQKCDTCDGKLEMIFKPQPRYVPFQNYFDIGLGVEITGRDHRRRVMRDLQCDHRDPPSTGDISARKDWAAEARKGKRNLTPRRRKK